MIASFHWADGLDEGPTGPSQPHRPSELHELAASGLTAPESRRAAASGLVNPARAGGRDHPMVHASIRTRSTAHQPLLGARLKTATREFVDLIVKSCRPKDAGGKKSTCLLDNTRQAKVEV